MQGLNIPERPKTQGARRIRESMNNEQGNDDIEIIEGGNQQIQQNFFPTQQSQEDLRVPSGLKRVLLKIW